MKKTVLAAAPLLLAAGQQQELRAEQPNFVILFVDDLGWADLGYQNPIFETPNIDKLKNNGVYFERSYVPTATSSPSRATLITGKQALRCGMVRHIYSYEDHLPADQRSEFQTLASDPGNMKSRSWLQLEEITYAERLKELGYYNLFVGKWHLGHEGYFPSDQGFDESIGVNEHGHPFNYYNVPFFKTQNPFPEMEKDAYLTEVLTDGAVDFIHNYDKTQPFLLNFWYYTVHSPHYGKTEYVEQYLSAGLNKQLANYAAMVRSLDDSVGRILEALAQSSKADNTVIIFTSDQGGSFPNGVLRGGKKGGDTIAEGGSRTPMIIYAPNASAMGSTYCESVSTTDIYPTLIELATGKPCRDKQIDGQSLARVLNGKKQGKRSIFLFRSYEDQNSAIIEGDWKLIKYRSGRLELYNLVDDISEANNLAQSESKLTAKMLKKLLKWEKEATPQELLQ